jgi:hypothetical protein
LGGIASTRAIVSACSGCLSGVAKQRADRRQPRVAGGGAVRALALEVVQEGRDELGVEIVEPDLAGGPCEPLRGEREQEPERVAVGGDRVRARLALALQALGEERLHRRGARGH